LRATSGLTNLGGDARWGYRDASAKPSQAVSGGTWPWLGRHRLSSRSASAWKSTAICRPKS